MVLTSLHAPVFKARSHRNIVYFLQLLSSFKVSIAAIADSVRVFILAVSVTEFSLLSSTGLDTKEICLHPK